VLKSGTWAAKQTNGAAAARGSCEGAIHPCAPAGYIICSYITWATWAAKQTNGAVAVRGACEEVLVAQIGGHLSQVAPLLCAQAGHLGSQNRVRAACQAYVYGSAIGGHL